MKRKGSAFLAVILAMQLLLSGIVTVGAENSAGIGKAYTAPQSPAITYNMNLDWKFYDTKTVGTDLWLAIAAADKDGKSFYEKDYDDSEWETVSIPHGIGGGTNSFTGTNYDAGGGYRSVLLYRKTFTVPNYAQGGKIFFELEGIRQAAYVWVNGEKVGYYETGITAMGFDLTNYVEPGGEAVIAICNDGTTNRGTTTRYIHESVPGQTRAEAYQKGIEATQARIDSGDYSGSDLRDLQNRKNTYQSIYDSFTESEKNETWATSFGDLNDKTYVGSGAGYVWNTKDFNEPQIGLVYNAYLHVKGSVYQTLPLYNNLKTTGNYIYADNFDIRSRTATIHVEAEIRNESVSDGSYTLEVAVTDADGNLKYDFESGAVTAVKASDAGVVYETAVESNVYDEENIANPNGLTQVNTPDVTYINVSYDAADMRFWSTDDPYLYTVYTILKDSSGNVVDVQKKDTGFRKNHI